jgi:hypothetical protein
MNNFIFEKRLIIFGYKNAHDIVKITDTVRFAHALRAPLRSLRSLRCALVYARKDSLDFKVIHKNKLKPIW